jgi:hypothetical protein
MVMEFWNLKINQSIRDIFIMIKDMDSVKWFIIIIASILEIGKMVNNLVKVNI